MKAIRFVVVAGIVAAAVAAFVLHRSAPTVLADAVKCDLSQYKASSGLTAAIDQDLLVVTWAGQNGSEVRARYAIDGGQPVIRDLAVRKSGGSWGIVGQNLTPEYQVLSGIRRFSTQQAQPLRAAGVTLTPEVIDKNRWYAFWDAPLVMPDGPEMREASYPRPPRAVPDPNAPPQPARGRGEGAGRQGGAGRQAGAGRQGGAEAAA